MKNEVDVSRQYGEQILDQQQLGTRVERLTLAVAVLGVAIMGSIVWNEWRPDPQPLLLDTSTGNIISNYETVLSGYTTQERAFLAKMAYEGLRRRVGIASVDGKSLEEWSPIMTPNGLNAWSNLSPRWASPHFVQPGFTRTVQVTKTHPDMSNPYAFTIDAIEREATVGKPNTDKAYKVRLTVYFTDPAVTKVMKIDGVVLHEEELVK